MKKANLARFIEKTLFGVLTACNQDSISQSCHSVASTVGIHDLYYPPTLYASAPTDKERLLRLRYTPTLLFANEMSMFEDNDKLSPKYMFGPKQEAINTLELFDAKHKKVGEIVYGLDSGSDAEESGPSDSNKAEDDPDYKNDFTLKLMIPNEEVVKVTFNRDEDTLRGYSFYEFTFKGRDYHCDVISDTVAGKIEKAVKAFTGGDKDDEVVKMKTVSGREIPMKRRGSVPELAALQQPTSPRAPHRNSYGEVTETKYKQIQCLELIGDEFSEELVMQTKREDPKTRLDEYQQKQVHLESQGRVMEIYSATEDNDKETFMWILSGMILKVHKETPN